MTASSEPAEGTKTIAAFPPSFAGDVIDAGHPDYDEARKVFNGMHDKRPALIARCTGARDVQLALGYARDQRLLVALRGGGHSTPGYSTCDGGIVIDVSPMKVFDSMPRSATAAVCSRADSDYGRTSW